MVLVKTILLLELAWEKRFNMFYFNFFSYKTKIQGIVKPMQVKQMLQTNRQFIYFRIEKYHIFVKGIVRQGFLAQALYS